MTEFLVTMACCFIAVLSLIKLALALDALGGYPTSPRRQLEAWSERRRDAEERHLRAIQMQAQSEIHAQEVLAAAREAFAVLATPSADRWVTLNLTEPIEPIEPKLEHWSDIRPSRSGPFTLEEPCE